MRFFTEKYVFIASVVCMVCTVSLVPSAAWAVHPFQVEETDTQGKGNMLLELNYDSLKDGNLKSSEATGAFTIGAGEDTDLGVEVPYRTLRPSPETGVNESGLGDVTLKLKYRLNQNEVKQSSGFQVFTTLPTGDVRTGTGTNNVAAGFKVMDQQECGKCVMHVSAGYEAFVKDMKKFHFGEDYAITFGLGLERKVTESFRLLAELAGERRNEKEFDNYLRPFTAMAGLKYDLTKNWYVDLAARYGLNKYAEDQTYLLGTAWRF